jgi:hypothetical protein
VVYSSIVRGHIVIVQKQSFLNYAVISTTINYISSALTPLETCDRGRYFDPSCEDVGESREGYEQQEAQSSSAAKHHQLLSIHRPLKQQEE